MGLITKAASLGAVAAVGALVANRDSVKKAVRGMIGSGKEVVHDVVDKTDELAARADKALAPAVATAKTKVKAVARAGTKKRARRKTRRPHAST